MFDEDFRVSSVTVRPSLNRVERDGRQIPLRPKSMGVLAFLASRAGRVATRNEILSAVWPGVSVAEEGLTQCIADIREALGDEAHQPRYIETVPKRGYRLIARVEAVGGSEPVGPPHAGGRRELGEQGEASGSQAGASGGAMAARSLPWRWPAWVGVAVAVFAVAVAGALSRPRRPAPAPPTVVQLTEARQAGTSSFSPDGTQIAFTSTGETEDNWDIWVKVVGDSEARRLTTDPADDSTPSWSPDGSQIAFVRLEPRYSVGSVFLVSAVTGAERRLGYLPASRGLSWSPDGRWLAVARRPPSEVGRPGGGIYRLPTNGGPPHPITFPKSPTFHANPVFSPDGRALAYLGCERHWADTACDVHVVPLDSKVQPAGPARRLTQQGMDMEGLVWTRDGRFVVYGLRAGQQDSHFWRVRADGTASPERIELAGSGALNPAVATSRDRLAFTRYHNQLEIHRLQGGTSAPLIRSAFADTQPDYAPDGRRIAFVSSRAADTEQEIWLADADGRHPVRLTHGPGRSQGSPRWSPDGRSIVFESEGEHRRSDVWTIGVDGSALHQVTQDPADATMPSWSHDGRFIYFTSNRRGHLEIYRVPAGGGTEEPLAAGFRPIESSDGRTLYYLKGGVYARPTAGGAEREVLNALTLAYAVNPLGLFYIDRRDRDLPRAARLPLHLLDARTGLDRVVGILDVGPIHIEGLSVSPDGRNVVYTHYSLASELMMIENFR